MVVNKSDLARKTKLSRQTIIKILNKKTKNPKIETLKKITKELKCTIEDLMD